MTTNYCPLAIYWMCNIKLFHMQSANQRTILTALCKFQIEIIWNFGCSKYSPFLSVLFRNCSAPGLICKCTRTHTQSLNWWKYFLLTRCDIVFQLLSFAHSQNNCTLKLCSGNQANHTIARNTNELETKQNKIPFWFVPTKDVSLWDYRYSMNKCAQPQRYAVWHAVVLLPFEDDEVVLNERFTR